MPDESRFCVVKTEISSEMIDAWERLGIERLRQNIAGVESITPYRTSIKQTWAAALSNRGPEAEAYEAVPRALLRRLYPGADGPVITDAQLVDRHEALKELRALLNPAKE